jgi:hypothetical protein
MSLTCAEFPDNFFAMKRLIILLLLAASLAAVSQSPGKVRHVVLIRNNRSFKFIRITENSMISVVDKTGKEFSGRVRSINVDTIFFNDTFTRVSEVDRLFYQNVPSIPGPFPQGSRRPSFIAGSPDYDLICPPDSVYASAKTYQVYFRNLVKQARDAQSKTGNPLGDTGYPTKDTTRPQRYKNFFKWNATKIAHLEIAFAYERLIVRDLTWETELSAIFGVQSADAYYTINQPLYNYNGFSVTTYPKYYMPDHKSYFSIVFMYRYLWATGIRTDWPDTGGSGNGKLQDQYRDDFGFSIRAGYMKRYGQFVVDFYAGAGIKYIMLHQLVYGSYRYHDSGEMHWYNEDHSPIIIDQNLYKPVLNLGVKIGFAF